MWMRQLSIVIDAGRGAAGKQDDTHGADDATGGFIWAKSDPQLATAAHLMTILPPRSRAERRSARTVATTAIT